MQLHLDVLVLDFGLLEKKLSNHLIDKYMDFHIRPVRLGRELSPSNKSNPAISPKRTVLMGVSGSAWDNQQVQECCTSDNLHPQLRYASCIGYNRIDQTAAEVLAL